MSSSHSATHPSPSSSPSINPQSKPLTIRASPFTYLHLTLVAPSSASTDRMVSLDLLTARTHLTAALQQLLGLTGAAIPVDFLKIDDRDAWVRVPREDGAAVASAVGGWVGSGEHGAVRWRVLGWGDWLGAVVAGGGRELFRA